MSVRKVKPMGPFAPPTPSEVDDERGQPMAVANDILTPHDAFMPTTASHDAYTDEVAGASAPPGRMMPHGDAATRQAERPEGYSRVDRHGFRHLLDEDEDDEGVP